MSSRSDRTGAEAPEEVQAVVAAFLEEHPRALLLEAGEVVFDLGEASHTLECTQGKVLLHVWSGERNQVRRLVSAVRRGRTLRLKAVRFGRTEPESLELVSAEGGRSPTARNGARDRYRRVLERVLRREFPLESLEGMRSTMDLEHSFGPAHTRGLLLRGQTTWAVLGVGAAESQAAIEGVLTVGILWMVYCRERTGPRRVVEGLRLFVPAGMAETTASRAAWLDARIAKYELYELDEATESMRRVDVADRGNVTTRLAPAPDETAMTEPHGRFRAAIPRVLQLLPDTMPREIVMEGLGAAHSRQRKAGVAGDGFEMRLRSSAELAFLRYGLEFARIRMSFSGQSFNREMEITIGSGPHETVLTEGNAGVMRERVHALFARRTAAGAGVEGAGDRRDPLFRLQPERWLESLLRENVAVVDAGLKDAPVYVQVGAVRGAADRGMLDLLAVTKEDRLAVIEVKAEEDLQLAMQGLDYWIRVRAHHLANVDAATGLGDLQRQGYFPKTRLQTESPVLFLVAPALRIHPATETVLRHFDVRVPWTLVALDERWRVRLQVVWRRRSDRQHAPTADER